MRARNIGTDAAIQPLLIFLDADVILPETSVKKIIGETTKEQTRELLS